jgi:hypothetical protein
MGIRKQMVFFSEVCKQVTNGVAPMLADIASKIFYTFLPMNFYNTQAISIPESQIPNIVIQRNRSQLPPQLLLDLLVSLHHFRGHKF